MLLAIVVIAVLVFAAFLIMTAVVGSASDRQAKEMLGRKDEILDEAFNGDEHVTIRAGLAHLPHDVILIGADMRGYDVISDVAAHGGRTLVFKRRAE